MKAPSIRRLPLMLSLLGVLAIGLGGVVELANAERHQSAASCVPRQSVQCTAPQLFPDVNAAREAGSTQVGPDRVEMTKPGVAGTRA